MSDDLRFRRSARDWLEIGPLEAPDRIVQAALLAIDSTPQERDLVPRRFQPRNRFVLLGAAAAAIAAIALGSRLLTSVPERTGTDAQPTASPALSAAPPTPRTIPELSKTYVSRLHGYSIRYPSGWTTSNALSPWPPGISLAGGAGASVDVIEADEAAGAGPELLAASQRLAAGWTAAQWVDEFCAVERRVDCGRATPLPTIDIGGRAGTLLVDGAAMSDGRRLFEATVVVDGRGYAFLLEADAAHEDFAALLATVEFRPAAAIALPSDLTVPAMPELTERFASTRFGLSLGYPAGWTAQEGDEYVELVGGASDPGSTPTATVYAQSAPLPDGQTAEAWLADQVNSGDQVQCPPPGNRHVLIGSQSGVLLQTDCAILGGRRHYRAATVAGGRGYTFHMDTTKLDEAWFEALLASVALDPAAAAP